MNKQQFDELYRAYRLYKKLNEQDTEYLEDAVMRLVNEKRNELFQMIYKAGGTELNLKFYKMQDAWRSNWDRYKNSNWIIRAYQRRNGRSIHQQDWDKINEMRDFIRKHHYKHIYREIDDIPF